MGTQPRQPPGQRPDVKPVFLAAEHKPAHPLSFRHRQRQISTTYDTHSPAMDFKAFGSQIRYAAVPNPCQQRSARVMLLTRDPAFSAVAGLPIWLYDGVAASLEYRADKNRLE